MAQKIITFDVPITREEYKQYKKVPFTVPDNIHSVTLKFDYDIKKRKMPGAQTEYSNLIDFGLFDGRGVYLGSSGSSKKEIFISENYSTPGYKRVPCDKGEWNLLCGVDKIKPQGTIVHVTAVLQEKEERFYYGDLHTHTIHSDGHVLPAILIKKAVRNGLDFFVSTDHNTNTACSVFPPTKNLCIIPGLELTCFKGHFNLLGSSEPLSTNGFHFGSLEELNPILDYAKKQGAVLSLNHPLCKNCGWRLPFEGFDYDTVELWNGPMRVDNANAVTWWHQELLKGKKKVAVGGSDYHADYLVTNLMAMPCTVVYAKDNTATEIMDGVRKGHCYITHKPNTSKLILTCKDKMMGDTLSWEKGIKVTLKGTLLRRGYRLVVYNNDTIIYDRIGKGEKTFEEELIVPERGFVRAEITHKLRGLTNLGFRFGMLAMMPQDSKGKLPDFQWALTNPIYFE